MPTDKPKALITMTPEMNNKLNALVLSDGWTMNKSETIRLAISELLEKHGIEIETTMPKRGTYNRED